MADYASTIRNLGLGSGNGSYDDTVQRLQKEDEDRKRMMAGFNLTSPADPDTEARVQQLSTQTGNAPDYTRGHLKEIEQREQLKRTNLKAMPGESPVLFNSLQDPTFAVLAKDDVDEMSYVERLWKSTSQSWQAGQRDRRIVDLTLKQMDGSASANDLTELDTLEKTNESLPNYGITGAFEGWVPETAKALPLMIEHTAGATDETAAGMAGGALWGSLSPDPLTTVAGGLAGAGFGYMSGIATESAQAEAAFSYREYIKMKAADGTLMDPDAARVAAWLVGAVNGGLESVQIGTITRTIPGGDKLLKSLSRDKVKDLLKIPSIQKAFARIGKNFGVSSITGAVQEALQETSTIAGGWLLAESQEGDFDTIDFDEALGRISEAGWTGLGVSAIMSTPGTAASIAIDTAKINQAQKNREMFLGLGESAKNSKTLKRSPEKYQKFVKDVQEKYGVLDDVYVDVDTLSTFFQEAGISPDQVAQIMPETSGRMAEASELGALVAIPLDEFATHIAPSEMLNQIVDDVKVHPDEPSAREAQQIAQEHADIVAQYEQMAEEENRAVEAARPVYEAMQVKFEQMGEDPEIAEKYSRLYEQLFAVAGMRSGKDPYELFKAQNLSIRRTPDGELDISPLDRTDSMLNALREGKGRPSEREQFGDSVIEAIRRHGGVLDEGGEISAMDLGGKGGIVREKGRPLDELRELLAEEGYGTTDEMDPNTLTEWIREEATTGKRRHALGNENQSAMDVAAQLDEMQAQLDEAGLDVSSMSNQEIRAAMNTLEQPAYHGTPHKFDKFSLDAIGTGEGAQAYGWGLYFAGRREIAEFYRDSLSDAANSIIPDIHSALNNELSIDSVYADAYEVINELLLVIDNDANLHDNEKLKSRVEKYAKNPENATNRTLINHDLAAYKVDGVNYLDALEERYSVVDEAFYEIGRQVYRNMSDTAERAVANVFNANMKYRQLIDDNREAIVSVVQSVKDDADAKGAGNLYQAEIPEDTELLDYDKPFSEQPEKVKQAIFKASRESEFSIGVDNIDSPGGYTGGQIYREIAFMFQMQGIKDQATPARDNTLAHATSEYLNSLGIPGLRYLDSASRGDDKNATHNYVIWDEDAVTVEAVNDELVQAQEQENILFQEQGPGQENLQAWAGDGAEFIDPDEVNSADYSGDGPFVLRVFHGTTNDIDVFDADVKGTTESQFGKVNYFTSSEYDATENYGESGPDITQRIERTKERLEFEQDLDESEAARLAREQHIGGEARVMDVYVRTEKPFVIGDGAHVDLFPGMEEAHEQAVKDVADDNDISADQVHENIEDYEDAIYEREDALIEQSIEESDLYDEIQTIAAKYETGLDHVIHELISYARDGGISTDSLEKLLRSDSELLQIEDPETGDFGAYQAIAEIIESLGYDSIILKDAQDRFSTMNMPEPTAHVHVFNATPENIKSATDNTGEYSRSVPNIYHQDNVEPVATVRGDELGDPSDIKTLRKNAVEFYKERYLNGMFHVEHPDVGRIDFRSSGLKHVKSLSGDVRKLQVFPVLDSLIATGRYRGKRAPDKANDKSKAYHYIENDVQIGNEDLTLSFVIREDDQGRFHYDHNVSDDIKKKARRDPNTNPGVEPDSSPVSAYSEDGHKGSPTQPITGDTAEAAKDHSYEQDSTTDNLNITFADRREGGTPARGYIQFPESRNWFRITMTGKANLSTFLHESGHFVFEMMRGLALEDDAAPGIKADYEKALKWMGVESIEAWEAMTPNERVPYHEKLARGFEAYLMEGKAPSAELRDLFRTFKGWLISVYKKLTALNVDLNDDIRAVFDRLVASDEAIRASLDDHGIDMLFEGMEFLTEDQQYAYKRAFDRMVNATAEATDRKLLEQVARAQSKVVQNRRGQIRAALEQQWLEDQAVNTRSILRTGKLANGEDVTESLQGLKLSTDALKEMYPDGSANKRLTGLHRKEGGAHPDIVADMLGYETGEALIVALTSIPNKSEWLNQQTDAALKAEFGDMLTDGTLPAHAARAVHSDAPGKFLHMELQALTEAAAPLIVYKTAAKNQIEKMSLRTLRPARYRQAEVKWAKESGRLLGKGDKEGAAQAKTRQIMNFYMYKAALEAVDDVNKIRTYLNTFSTRKVRERVGKASRGGGNYLEAIDALIEGVDFRKGTSFRAISRRGALDEWIAKQEAAGEVVAIPDKLRRESKLTSYKVMSIEDLRGLRDSVKHIAYMAKVKNQLIYKNEKRNFDATVTEMVDNIEANIKPRKRSEMHNPTGWEELKRKTGQFANAGLTKVEFLAMWADNKDRKKMTPGAVHKSLYQPLADAMALEYDLIKRHAEPLIRRLQNMPARQRRRLMRKHVFNGQTYHGHDVLAILLNMGNEGNKTKLIEGYGWAEQDVWDFVFSVLQKEDIELAQAIWDDINGLWPHIESLHKRVTGVAPPKVEAIAFDTPFGRFDGGYYPVVYDSNRSLRAADLEDAQQLFEHNFLQPKVSGGFTEARTGFVGPIRLSLDVIPGHMNEVVHYLSHYDAVSNVTRLLKDPRFANAVKDHFGPEYLKSTKAWLKNIANDRTNLDALQFTDKMMRHLRTGTSVVAMGFNVWTGIAQTMGLATTVKEIGVGNTALGVREFMKNPIQQWKWVNERSGEMRHIAVTFDRELKMALDSLLIKGKMGALKHANKNIVKAAFLHIAYIQKSVNIVSWLGAYHKFQADNPGLNDIDAVRYADSVVRRTQSGGGAKDLAGIQRGNELAKMVTMFYTYFSVLYNQFRDVGRYTKKVNDLGWAAGSALWLIAAPIVFEAFFKGKEPDDDESWAQWFATESLLYGTTAIPFARDMASGAMGDYGYSFSPVVQAIESMVRTGGKAIEGDFDETFWKHFIKNFGTLTHIPTNQGWKMFDYAVLRNDEIEDPVREFITGVRHK